MAASTSGKRKAATPAGGKRAGGTPTVLVKPKAAKAKKPIPASAKPVRENAPATGLSKDSAPLEVVLLKEAQLMPGCGFGIDQSVLHGTIAVKLPPGFDLSPLEAFLEEFAIEAPDGASSDAKLSPEAHLVSRVHAWHSAVQRGLNVPVFGGCRLWDRGIAVDGARRIAFAVPSHTRAASLAAMQFVIDALLASSASAGDTETTLSTLRKKFASVRQTLARHALIGINQLHFLESAHALGIEHTPWVDQIWAFGHGRHRVLFNSTVTSATPQIGVATAKDKLRCSAVLRVAGLPVAQSGFAQNADTAARLAQHIGYPVVVKPANMDQGHGVTAGIEDEKELRKAFAEAARISKRVMVEKHHFGRDYRVTVLHGKVIKVMDRRPGGVTGDGHSTVAELVQSANDHDKAMRAKLRRQRAPMLLDEEALKLLDASGYTSEKSVIPEGEFVALRRRANISAGGTYEVLPPAAIHPDNRLLAVNATYALGLDIAGIDIISGDPAKSWRETGGVIVEVNAQPQIGFRDTEQIFGEILIAAIGSKGRIPIHLVVTPEGFHLSKPLPQLAASFNCNAASWRNEAWIAGAGSLGPFSNALNAGKSILLDTRTTAALIVMTEKDVLRLGLPAARFASIRLLGGAEWTPHPVLQPLLRRHADQLLRQHAALQQPAGRAD